ncbi:MAG TPA: PDZ domain-containing protein [Pyrinomonadaceae bacterium]|jgi:hypothetical protein
MNYEQTKNNAHESEPLSADEQKLSALLGNLKRVEAPKDFDFKLKARIAAGSPADERKPFLFPALRYVLPLCLVVMLSAFAALRIFAPGDAPDSTTVAEQFQPSNQTETASANAPGNAIFAEEPAKPVSEVNQAAPTRINAPKISNKDKQTLAVVKSSEKSGEKQDVKLKNASGGSYVAAVRAPKAINLGPNGVISDNTNSGQSGKINIHEVLSEIGIEVEFVGADCKVVSVREGTAARIANFQPGDLIQTIDDKKLSSDTSFAHSFKGKVFKVVRAGKQMVIDLTKR